MYNYPFQTCNLVLEEVFVYICYCSVFFVCIKAQTGNNEPADVYFQCLASFILLITGQQKDLCT